MIHGIEILIEINPKSSTSLPSMNITRPINKKNIGNITPLFFGGLARFAIKLVDLPEVDVAAMPPKLPPPPNPPPEVMPVVFMFCVPLSKTISSRCVLSDPHLSHCI